MLTRTPVLHMPQHSPPSQTSTCIHSSHGGLAPDSDISLPCALQGTVYGDSYIAAGGAGTNGENACSFGTNAASVDGLPWASAPGNAPVGPAGVQTTYIAMNHVDWDSSAMCGTCLWFRSQGAHLPQVLCLSRQRSKAFVQAQSADTERIRHIKIHMHTSDCVALGYVCTFLADLVLGLP